jgi:glycosyltransferase involved in cell wall biosynthesis
VTTSLPVTPVLLTLDEEPNLTRTLDALHWADRVLVVDSGSRDRTVEIARSYPNVEVATRAFTTWSEQWSFAFAHPAVRTRYVLALDADMRPDEGFVEEVATRFLPGEFAGGRLRFRYVVGGRSLLGSLYPPDLRLLDVARARAGTRGHRHVFEVEGRIYRFRARLLHDDRKPLTRWLRSQEGYVEREARRIEAGESLRLRDRIRRLGLAPLPVFLAAYLRAGGPLRGGASLRYAYERATYETLLALRLGAGAHAPISGGGSGDAHGNPSA